MVNIKSSTSIGNRVVGFTMAGDRALVTASLLEAKNFGIIQPSILAGSQNTVRFELGKEAVAIAKLRELVQRGFNKERKARAAAYADYLLRVREGVMGGAPAINLFCSEQIIEDDAGDIFIPFGSQVFAIDGETQLEARFINAERLPETALDPIPFVFWHGIPAEHGAMIVHDFNTYAHPIKEADLAARNVEGAVTKAVSKGIGLSGIPTSKINMIGSSLRKQSHITGFEQLLGAACGVINGEAAMKHGGYNRVLKENNFPGKQLPEKQIASAIGTLLSAIEDHPEVSRATPLPVWTALGYFASKGRPITVAEFRKANSAYEAASRGGKADAVVRSLKTFI